MFNEIENLAPETIPTQVSSSACTGPARRAYESLVDGEFSPAQQAQARDFLVRQLDAASVLDADLPRDMHALPAWLADGVARTGRLYREYLAGRKAGGPRRYFSNKSHALHFLKGVAPTKLVDGAWLYGLLDYNDDPRYASLIKIYLEELGDGMPGKNHVVLYKKLLAANDCDQWQELDDDCYVQGAIQLALAHHAQEFLPEVIGFNLGYEQLPLHLPITAFELNELGIDPYYFTLHITIDNADTGHARKALQGLVAAMPKTGDPEDFYRRVRNGYMLNALGAGTESVIRSFDLEREVVDIFKRKSVVGKHMHSDYCRVAGRSVTDWLSEEGQIPAFLAALEGSGWIKRHQDPANSRFWKLLQGDRADMFGVFSALEQQAIYDWIAGKAILPGAAREHADAGGAAFAQRHLSFRARRRLLDNLEAGDAPSTTAALWRQSPRARDGERETAFDDMDSMDEFDADVRMLNEQISAMTSRGQLMRLLVEWMSPALHHTQPGLMATRLFAARFNAASH